jgi:hypothetical protein
VGQPLGIGPPANLEDSLGLTVCLGHVLMSLLPSVGDTLQERGLVSRLQ